MTTMIQGDEVRAIAGGIFVNRATATLPQTGAESLFTITGGGVHVVSLIGEVTTVIETQLNNTQLVFNPTATGADTDLCATLDITADAVGTFYSLTGTAADPMTAGLQCLLPGLQLASPLYLEPGDIELSCSASNTGSVAWKLLYYPIDNGAAIVAA